MTCTHSSRQVINFSNIGFTCLACITLNRKLSHDFHFEVFEGPTGIQTSKKLTSCRIPLLAFETGDFDSLNHVYFHNIKLFENVYFLNTRMIFCSCLSLKGVLHLWALFLKTLCISLKNKATLDIVSYGSGQKCSKELKNHSFPSVETIVVKLQ